MTGPVSPQLPSSWAPPLQPVAAKPPRCANRPQWLDAYAGRRIVITGAGGYIASAIVSELGATDCSIRRVYRQRKPTACTGLRARIEDVQADVRERLAWRRLVAGADFVFHLAAQTSSAAANDRPLADLDANLLPMSHLLQSCEELGRPPAVLFAGTATEVGLTVGGPVGEEVADTPITIYDLHKLVAEKYLQDASWRGVVSAVTLRLANVYGPGQTSSQPDRGILNRMIVRSLRGESLLLFGDGSLIRDYSFIDDVAAAFVASGANIDTCTGSVFIVGSGEGHTMAEAAQMVVDAAGRRTGRVAEIRHVPWPDNISAIERRSFIADTTRIRAATAWAPLVPLATGIERTIDTLLASQIES